MNDFSLITILLLFVAVPTGLCFHEWRTRYYLWRVGVILPARVLFMWEWKMGFSRTYYLIYEIEGEGANGEPFYYTRQAELSKEQYLTLEDGGELSVVYSPSYPNLFRIEGQPSNVVGLTIGTLIAWAYVMFMAWVVLF